MRITKFLRDTGSIGVAIGVAAFAQCAAAQTSAPIIFSQPSQPLAKALRQVAASSGWELYFSPGDVEGIMAPPLNGTITPQEAVSQLLAGTSLAADYKDGSMIVRGREAAPRSTRQGSAPDASQMIVVTGTRIKGATPASPIRVITTETMKDAGQNNLGDALRALPQSFGGGQNPGVSLVPVGLANDNVNNASSFNLRGLGQDATLTLLNGHRMSFSGSQQAIDVSAIPIAAVDRVEILLDGASAIYGTDAVGGVANIILKKRFDGLETSARLGTATDGGDFQQQYYALAGTSWGSGGGWIAYDYSSNNPVRASQRSYTSGLSPDMNLLSSDKKHSVIVNGSQELSPGIEIALDASYLSRGKLTYQAYNSASYLDLGARSTTRSESYSITPSVTVALAPQWSLHAFLVRSEEKTRITIDNAFGGNFTTNTKGCYCNELTNAEGSIEGAVFQLPGGAARIAIGGGYRLTALDSSRTDRSLSSDFSIALRSRDSQKDYYGYGEIQLPLVGPAQDIPFVHRLTASGAVRYENYPGMANVATPKLGLVYAPSSSLDLKASWGRSFKAPTIFNLNFSSLAYLYDASAYISGAAAGTTIIQLDGGNRDLKPERATSWTATANFHPVFVPGLELEVGYFNVDYKDRIVMPITSISSAFSNAVGYAGVVFPNPTSDQIAAALALADAPITNYSSVGYDPTKVVGLVYTRFLNSAKESAKGIDLSARYALDLEDGQLSFDLSTSFLRSNRQLFASQPSVQVAGIIFNPPRFRGRAGATWTSEAVSLSAWFSRIGSVSDNRPVDPVTVHGQDSVDLSLRYHPQASGAFHGLELAVSVLNLFDTKPDTIGVPVDWFTPYDSTNYSAIGRYLNFSITKRW